MWTADNRPRYNRDKLRYPSDLTDAEWAHIEPLIPHPRRRRRPATERVGGAKRQTPHQGVTANLHMALLGDVQYLVGTGEISPPGDGWRLVMYKPHSGTASEKCFPTRSR